MTKITWNDPGTRRYYTGVDRGMLYTGIDIPSAVPWNGLIAVMESPVINSPQAFYLDGRKTLNIPGGENFQATIESFAAPPEFASSAGRSRLSIGLFAAEQPKQSFAFSYRTLIANDIREQSFAYRIHVVYNALAQISNFVHGTNTDVEIPASRSWTITTRPISLPGLRPAAHIIFDTRFNSADSINGIEGILYGDSESGPRLPTPSEIVTMLAF